MRQLVRTAGILAALCVALVVWLGAPAAALALPVAAATTPTTAPATTPTTTTATTIAPTIAPTGVEAVPSNAAGRAEARAAGPLRADVNDFEIASFDADYHLGRDAEGRSTLRTVERIVAVFPEFDQNRGIIRDIPSVYDGHGTEPRVVSVTDETGSERPFTTEENGDFLSVTIAVPEGEYVHGEQSYVIEYTQRDVTKRFDDTAADEFYWDVNGTGWRQPFGEVRARVTLEDGLESALTGESACYRGASGSSDPCQLTVDGPVVALDEQDLGPGENVTFAIGFDPGTFAAALVPFLERVPLLIYGGLASLAGAIALGIATVVRGRRGARTGDPVIAQYEPPEGVSLPVSAELLRAGRKAMTASLLDLAVRGRIRLLHDEASGQYGAQGLGGDGLADEDGSLYRALFSSDEALHDAPQPTVWFSPGSTLLGDAAAAMRTRARAAVKRMGLVGRVSGWAVGGFAALLVIALALPVLHAILLGDFVMMSVLLAVGINVLIWVLLVSIISLRRMRPRTLEGARLHDHFLGLREYIRLAEADRIRMLQSASGAEVDASSIVRVYERLLPYAVLFGFEREWQAELSRYYRESGPEWVAGSADASLTFQLQGFHAAVAASPIAHAVSSSGAGSGSGSSFSSSFGGSSGGGFSDGGGGGGGGGGI
ncbi:MAG: DUF2207 domain-containing protein [Leucobacter sp.]